MRELWNRISNTKSLMAIAAALLVILETFGIIDVSEVQNAKEIITSVCSVLVLMGILNNEGMDTPKLNK